jgi:hypothetical protein
MIVKLMRCIERKIRREIMRNENVVGEDVKI